MGLMNRLFPLRVCPECMQIDVPADALRCKYCCSTLEPIKKKSKSGDTMETIATAPAPAAGMSGNTTTGAAAGVGAGGAPAVSTI
jgi:hypothetical protein